MQDDTLIHFGDSVKVLDSTDGETKVGGLLVHFDEPGGGGDLAGEYFTSGTYFGAQAKANPDGFVLDSMFNHGIPTSPQLKALAEHEFLPLKAAVTDTGIMAEILLRERDEYEAMVAELAKKGKLGWSSGSAPHAVRKATDGSGATRITRWPLIEGSLTHRPAEPRTSATTLKSLAHAHAGAQEKPAQEKPAQNELARIIGASLKSLREDVAQQTALRQISDSIRTLSKTIKA